MLMGLPVLFGLFLLSGCGDNGYPESLTYPPRTDPVVIAVPKAEATALDRPGEYPNLLFANLPEGESRARLLLDPTDTAKVKADDRQKISKIVADVFGTPAHPTVKGVGSDETKSALEEMRNALKLDDTTLATGASLYRQHCLHCHGLTGDGRGPTSPWVNPHPRDYRQGVFKFTSSAESEGKRKPRKEDLIRTMREGIEGTSMPSFRLLGDDEFVALASYVIHLSFRGETELLLLKDAGNGDPGDPDQTLAILAQRWVKNQQASLLIEPDTKNMPSFEFHTPQHKASVLNGFKLFTEQKEGGCISCHLDYGRQSGLKYDAWGTIVRPADLTVGIYRGGRRPIDLYNRIHSGVNGSGMTAFKDSLTSDKIWDLVNFLQVLPYRGMLKEYGIKLEAD
jgi:mono/diheme cytochrome c family protein